MTDRNTATEFGVTELDSFTKQYSYFEQLLQQHVRDTIHKFEKTIHMVDADFHEPDVLDAQLYDILDTCVVLVCHSIMANACRLNYYVIDFKTKICGKLYNTRIIFDKGRHAGSYEFIEEAILVVFDKDDNVIKEIYYHG